MKYLFAALMLLSFNCFGQTGAYWIAASADSTKTAYNVLMNKTLRIPLLGTSNTALFLQTDANGVVKLGSPAGSGTVTSIQFAGYMNGGTVTTSGIVSPDTSTGKLATKTNLLAYALISNVNAALALKLNLTDTASMLTNYLRSASAALLYYPLNSNPAGYLTTADISGKMNYTDTAAMLNPYQRKGDSATYYPVYRSDTSRTNIYSAIAGKQASGNYITALTGDVVATGPGSASSTLATVNSNTGVIGDATHVGQITLNAKGLATAATAVLITPAESSVTFTDITTGDVSTSKHGYAPKAPNDATKYLDGTGAYSVPSGTTAGTVTTVAVTPTNGVSAVVTNPTTTPNMAFTLGAIVPTSVNGVTISGSSAPTLAVTGATTVSGTNTGDQTSVTGNAGTATALQTARTIGGVSFDGTANITVATATGGFTVSGGDLALGANNITMTGILGATGARLTKIWATDLTVTNAINGSVTGNAATVTTNANLTGDITSTGNAVANVVTLSHLTTAAVLATIGTVTSGGLGTGAVIAGVTMTLGSDATGDVYYRNSSGILTRLANGGVNTLLHGGASVPAYSAVVNGDITNGTIDVTTKITGRVPSANLPTDIGYLDVQQSWTQGQAGTPVTLTDASTVAINLASGNNFRVTLGGNRTMGVPTNIVAGQTGDINFWQDITGSRTITLPWPYSYSAASAPTLSTGKAAMDKLVYAVDYYATSAAITATNAAPGVFTWTAHGLITGQMIQFSAGTTTTPVLNTTYWVTVTGANTFNISTTFANCQAATLVTTSGTSGNLTATACGISVALNTDFRR